MQVNINDEKKIVYNLFTEYFGDLIMTKVKQTLQVNNKPSYSLYYAKVGCLLCIDNRYVVALVENDQNPIGKQFYMSSLPWVSLQTRTLNDFTAELRTQEYKQKSNKLLTDKINVIQKTPEKYIYMSSHFPLRIELLLTKNDQTYANSGTIHSAIEMYNSVFSFTV